MSTKMHKIKAYLYDNLLTENPNDFIARVASESSLNVKQICDAACTRGGADIAAASMQHAVELFLKEMSYQLCDGYSVNTGYFTANVQIRGIFDSKLETFNNDKHSVLFRFNQGEILRKELKNVSVEILGVAENEIIISHVVDAKTGSVNDMLSPGKNLKIKGSKLRVVGDNSNVGIYFINETTQERVKVQTSEIVVNNPSELIIVIPDLNSGQYKLEIINQFANKLNFFLKEPRSTIFDKILTVQ